MHRFAFLAALFLLVTASDSFAQFQVHWIEINQRGLPVRRVTNDGYGNITRDTSIPPNYSRKLFMQNAFSYSDTGNRIVYETKVMDHPQEAIKFSINTVTNRIHDFAFTLTDAGQPQSYSAGSIRFRDVPLRHEGGEVYRATMRGAEIKEANYTTHTEFRNMISPGVYSSMNVYSMPPNDTSYVEVIFNGTIPLEVEADVAKSVTVYPNPASDYFTVVLQNSGDVIELYDVLGRNVKAEVVDISSRAYTLDVRGLEPGVYWLHAGKQTAKLVLR